MSRVTVTIDESHEEIIADVRERHDCDSRAAAMRACIEDAGDLPDLEAELQQRDARVNELESQLMQANSRIDAANADTERADELVRVIDRERSLEERRASAGALTRLSWWLTGMPDDGDGE